jgi:hypothetical protein
MNHYKLTVKSNSGKFRFKIIATDEQTAKLIVMKSEGCPESAIVKTECTKLFYSHKNGYTFKPQN